MPRIFINQPPKTWKQDIEALHSNRFFHVSNIGPTMFVLKADDLTSTTFKVCIGEPQQCSCGGGDARSKLCVHLLFVMIKVLRVPETNPLSWQLSLVDSEVLQILSSDPRIAGAKDVQEKAKVSDFLRKGSGTRQSNSTTSNDVEQKQTPSLREVHSRKGLLEDNLCSICQEEMHENDFQDGNLCFCQNGCGSNFHTRCLRMYSTHARSENKAVVCPMCRQKWIQAENKATTSTNRCLMRSQRVDINKPAMPIVRCKGCKIEARSIFYRAVKLCSEDKRPFDLCRRCFENGTAIYGSAVGCDQVFVKANASEYPVRWVPAVLPMAYHTKLLGEIQHRELTSLDYQTLLSLDDARGPPMHHHLLRALDAIDVSDCVGLDCVMCASPLVKDVCAMRLPCEKSHIVHKSCALSMLIDSESKPNGAAGSTCQACNNSNWIFPALMRQPKKNHEPKPASFGKDENSEALLRPTEATQLYAIGLPALHGESFKPKSMELALTCCKKDLSRKKQLAATPIQTRPIVSSTKHCAEGSLGDVMMIGKPLQTSNR